MRTLLVSALALGFTASISVAAEPSRTMLTDDQMAGITAGQTVTVTNSQTNPSCLANCNNQNSQAVAVASGRYADADATSGSNTNTQRLVIYKYRGKKHGKRRY